MTDTPTAYSVKWNGNTPTYTPHYRRCDKCDERASNFIEVYNPRTKSMRTVYLCDSCQAKLCAQIDFYLRGVRE